MEGSLSDQPFSCPICQLVVDIPPNGLQDFPQNFLLVSLMDRLNLESRTGSTSTTCHFCEGNESIQLCLDCCLYICSTCIKVHEKIPDCCDHAVIPTEKLHDEIYMKDVIHKKPSRCTKHLKEKLRFFCTSCKTLVCRDCAVVSHQGHTCVEAEAKLTTVKQELESALKESGKYVETVSGIRKNITLAKHKIETYMLEEKRQVKEYYIALVERLTSEKNKLIAKIEEIETEKEGNWKELDDSLTSWQGVMENTQEVTKKVLEADNQWDILAVGKDITDAFIKLRDDETTFTERFSTAQKTSEINGIKFLRNLSYASYPVYSSVSASPFSKNILGILKSPVCQTPSVSVSQTSSVSATAVRPTKKASRNKNIGKAYQGTCSFGISKNFTLPS